MTLPTFSIGDEVVVIGPTRYGCIDHIGIRFVIEQIENEYYSNPAVSWYPSSSLQLVNKSLLLLMQVTYNYKPDDYEHGTIQVSCPCGRKAEIALPEKSEWEKVPDGLKIGDWVKRDDLVFQISDVHTGSRETLCFNESNQTWYSSTSLRKLTPEEVQAHRNPGKPTYEYPITPAKDFDDLTLRDIARMSGICKNEHGVWISTLLRRAHKSEERLSAIEKRLAFIEKIQHDQDDLIGRAIRDGVVEILDFRRNA